MLGWDCPEGGPWSPRAWSGTSGGSSTGTETPGGGCSGEDSNASGTSRWAYSRPSRELAYTACASSSAYLLHFTHLWKESSILALRNDLVFGRRDSSTKVGLVDKAVSLEP